MKVALIQDSPVLFDLEASLQKVETLVAEANEPSVDLVLFPEAYLSAYPRGLSFGTVVGSRSEFGRDMWLRYWESSLKVPGQAVDRLGEIAKTHDCFLVIGVIEQGETGTLYCTMLYFDHKGTLLGKHRKLKPTAAERIVWGEGDGTDLHVYDSPYGKLGGLICWENYMPLARTWLYQQGVEIYMAPTADQRDSWQATMQHIACEGRCYVLGCNQYVTRADYPNDLPGEDVSQLPEVSSRGGSVIVDPLGQVIAGPLWDERGILRAELDLKLVTKGKMDFDPVGHYARNDVFQLLGPEKEL
ncbi:MAG: carbon-nitrogen hydrolase family protein [Cytophagales bacterium]|nr:carbon-nitrogen hydrolase family protein [Cytophagales bacterium]